MKQQIALTAVIVRNFDEAWVLVAPPGATESRLLLARFASAEVIHQEDAVRYLAPNMKSLILPEAEPSFALCEVYCPV